MSTPSMTRVEVLVTLDAVACGCALYADKCVGETKRQWAALACDEYDKARATIESLYETIAELRGRAERAEAALRGIVHRTEQWNTSMQAVIGRVPDSGIHLAEGKAVLAAIDQEAIAMQSEGKKR